MTTSPSFGALGKLQGKYRVLAQLGQGGTANVMLAVARGPSGFNKLVVLKSMKGNVQAEPEIGAMFLSEARLAARLNHPNVVQTNEVFESSEGPVIVMEYLEGQSLSHIISRARGKDVFDLRMHLRVICEALAGLHHAHELTDFDGRPLGVVHRDVSPHNVFVTFDGQVKVLDFGIAKLAGATADTATGVIKGKLRYMAPEQITGDPVDRRADLFAVGIMLWEAVAGGRMWKDATDVVIMNRILNDELPSLREVKPDVPDELLRIVARCLAPEPKDRYANAADLLHDLERYLAGLDGTEVRSRDIGAVVAKMFDDSRRQMREVIEGQLAKVASLSSSEADQVEVIELTSFGTQTGLSTSSPASERRKKNNQLLLLGFALVLVLLLATVVWGPWRQESVQAPPIPAHPPVAAQQEINLRFTAFPATSKLYMDGKLLPSNPFSRQFPKDEKEQVTIEVRAPGHVTERRTIPLDQDADIVVTLTPEEPQKPKEPTSPPPSTTKKTQPKTPSSSQSTKPKAGVSCDPPFVIDARGVKRYKPECL